MPFVICTPAGERLQDIKSIFLEFGLITSEKCSLDDLIQVIDKIPGSQMYGVILYLIAVIDEGHVEPLFQKLIQLDNHVKYSLLSALYDRFGGDRIREAANELISTSPLSNSSIPVSAEDKEILKIYNSKSPIRLKG